MLPYNKLKMKPKSIPYKFLLTDDQVLYIVKSFAEQMNIAHILFEKHRYGKIVQIRFILYEILNRRYGISTIRIKRIFNMRNHTSVLHGIQTSEINRQSEPLTQILYSGIYRVVRQLAKVFEEKKMDCEELTNNNIDEYEIN